MSGFLINLLVLMVPPAPFDLAWRVSFLEQVGDRSLILLFGSALLLYSQLSNRRVIRRLSFVLLGVGVALLLSSVLVVRDTLILQEQMIGNIGTQSAQLQSQIEARRSQPEVTADITAAQFEQASQALASQADVLKRNTRSGLTRAGLVSIGNLSIVGMGLVGLGRFGLSASPRLRPRPPYRVEKG